MPLADGRVLIAMCSDASRIYDPTNNILDLAGSNVPDGRVDGTAGTLLHSGKVLLSGGVAEWAGPATVAANLYDPASGTFTTSTGTRSLTDARSHHSSTLLPDGQVLLAGGSAFNGSDDKTTADLYNPGTGEFTRIGSLVVPRHLPLATLLADGRVLIAGGYTPFSNHQYWQPTNTVEIYTPSRLIPAPALSSLSGDGKGQGTILRAGTGRPANPANPTRAGEALEIFLTGLLDGSVIPPQVSIGGRMAEVLYFGRAPGLANTNQVNVRVPAGVAPGPAVPVRMMYLGRPSNEVTIAVQ